MPDALSGTTSTPIGGFNSVTGAANTTATTTGETAKKPGGDLDKDAFLKLLVAQLKYQNPMSPADPSEFLGQTAQFTMVEKLEAISKAQSDLTVWQKISAGQALVGRQVTGTSSLGTDVTGVVTGLSLSADGPELVLADGSRLPVAKVTQVAAAPAAPTGATTAPAATAGSTTAARSTTTTGSTSTGSTTTGSTTPASTGDSAVEDSAGPAGGAAPATDPAEPATDSADTATDSVEAPAA